VLAVAVVVAVVVIVAVVGATAVVLALILIMATVALLAPVLPVGTLLTVMPTAGVQTLSGHRRESLEMRSKIDAGNGSVLKTIHYNKVDIIIHRDTPALTKSRTLQC